MIPLPQPTRIAARYSVVRVLGRGGMGVVYEVEHLNTGKHHALKVLQGRRKPGADVVRRFKIEALLPARIGSENVVDVTDADVAPELDGAPFLVMELLDGEDLNKLCARRGTLRPEELAWVIGQAARGIDKAHGKGIVHRDLKPENIFLHRREDGSVMVKLLDFGIAKLTDDAKVSLEQVRATQDGLVLGSPSYMSFEQARSSPTLPVGPPADLWAIGMVAFRLLTGRTYWPPAAFPARIDQIVRGEMPRPSRIVAWLPPAFDAWFARSCDRDPTKRFATAGEQADALERALGVVPRPPTFDVGGDIAALQALDAAPRAAAPALLAIGRSSSDDPTAPGPVATPPADRDRATRTTEIRPAVSPPLDSAAAPTVSSSPGRARAGRGARALGLTLLVVGCVGALVEMERRAPSPPTRSPILRAPVVDAAPPPLPTEVVLRIDSVPPGAEVTRADNKVRVGRTPCELSFDRGDGVFAFVVRLDGYRSAHLELPLSRDGEITARLTRRSARAAASPDASPVEVGDGLINPLEP